MIESFSTFGGPDGRSLKHGVFQQRAFAFLEEGAVEGPFEGEDARRGVWIDGKGRCQDKVNRKLTFLPVPSLPGVGVNNSPQVVEGSK